ncbi:MAG: hypothetical protein M0C28_11970 [Candidatus Moduliflexus flocculans]|nr:hypothetical protein [Candidatus Moduliflexus flocculans]
MRKAVRDAEAEQIEKLKQARSPGDLSGQGRVQGADETRHHPDVGCGRRGGASRNF